MTRAARARRAPRKRVRLGFEGWTVEVASDDAADLRWLAAFLACGFAEVRARRADARVDFVVDAAACDRLQRAGEPGRPLLEGFAGDAKPARVEPWLGGGRGRVFRDRGLPVFYRVSRDGRRVVLVARERTPQVRRRLMRVVRELAMARTAVDGGLLVHASAVACEGGVVVMCGPRRSGKTTLLLSLLGTQRVRYVANDRCVVRVRSDGASVRGLPTLVAIRRDTLARVPGLRRRLGRTNGTSLSPAELCERLGAPAEAGGPLAALVFPRVGRHRAKWRLRRLAPEEALPRLRAGLFRASRRRLLGQVFVSAREPRHALGARALARGADRRLAESVPCFECRLGGGAAPGASESRALLGRLAAAAARPGDPHA